MKASDCFEIGYITKTRGLKGEVQVYLQVDAPEAYSEMESVFLEINKKLVPFFIDRIQINQNLAYIFFEDIDSIEKAKELLKKKVFLRLEDKPEDDLPHPAQSFVGYQVSDLEKGMIGTISEILEMPQQQIAVLRPEEKEILFPLNKELIRDIDHSKKILYVVLPEGLLDIYLE